MILTREKSTDTETMGRLVVDGTVLHTIERPWLPTDPGGKPNESCVPAGRYDLIFHTRPNGHEVIALVNPGLGVYYQASDRPRGVGRYLILIHVGNYSHDIIGCIAPGMGRTGKMVTSSRSAMKVVMASEDDFLLIEDA